MKTRAWLALSVLLATLGTGVAHAQADAPRGAAERRVVIDMDADVIEGVRLVPPMQVIGGKGDTRHKSLIQLRKDFRREVLASGSRL